MAFARPRLRADLLAVLAIFALLAGAGGWLLGSNGGLRWITSVAQAQSGGMLEISGAEGALFDAFGLQRLVVRGKGWRIELDALRAEWHPLSLLRGELKVTALSARQLDLLTVPGDPHASTPAAMPATLRLPLALTLDEVRLGTLRWFKREDEPPVQVARDLHGAYRGDQKGHHLRDLRVRFDQGTLQGEARIGADAPYPVQATVAARGDLPLPDRPVEMNARAEVSGDLARLEVYAAAAAAGTQINASTHLNLTAPMPLGDTHIAFGNLDLRGWLAAAPATELSGSLDLSGTEDGAVQGSFQFANARPTPLDADGVPLTRARAQLRVSDAGKWQLRALELGLLRGGLLRGEANGQGRQADARVQVHNFDPSILDRRAPTLSLQGEMALDAAAKQQKIRFALHDTQWNLAAELLKRGMQLDVAQLRVQHGNTVLGGSGQIQLDAQRPFHLDTRLQHLNLAEFIAVPPTELNAGLVIDGTLLPQPAGLLDFVFFDSRFGGYPFDGDARLRVLPGPRAQGDLNARLGANTLALNLHYGMTAEDSLDFVLEAPRLEQLGNGMGGSVSGQMTLRGSAEAPLAGFVLNASRLQLPNGFSMEALAAGGTLEGQQIKLHLNAESVRDGGTFSLPQIQLDLDGTPARHTLHAEASLARSAQALGDFNLAASGGWARTDTSWRWQGVLDALAARGVLPLQLQAPAALVVAPEEVNLGTARFALAGGRVALHETRWTPQDWHSAGSMGNIGVRIAEAGVTPEMMHALDTLRFGGDWDISGGTDWRGTLGLRRESGDWVVNAANGQHLGLRDVRLDVQAAAQQLDVKLQASGDPLGDIALQLALPYSNRDGLPWVAPDAPLRGQIKLNAPDLAWLGPLFDGNLHSGGSLHLEAGLLGTRDAPRLQGNARGNNLRVALLDQGVTLEQGELAVRFEPQAVVIDRFDFVAPYLRKPKDPLLSGYRLPRQAGHLSATGHLSLLDDAAQLSVQAEGLPLAQRADRWLLVSGRAQATNAGRTIFVSGEIAADAGLITHLPTNRPRLADDVRLVGQAPPEASAFSRVLGFNLELGEHFYLRAMGLESRLSGGLAISGAADEPLQASGTIATENGIIEVYGQRLEVERGMINFQGPLDDPGLNILALRKGLAVEAGVEVSGTARHPVTRLVSTPDVPDAEKLSWIALGRLPESGGVDASLLLAAAGGAIGGSSGSSIGRTIGVDELSLHQIETADAQQSQAVTVGKRLSSRAYLSYEQDLANSGGFAKFSYTLTPRLTVVTRTGTGINAGVSDAIDLFYSFRFY